MIITSGSLNPLWSSTPTAWSLTKMPRLCCPRLQGQMAGQRVPGGGCLGRDCSHISCPELCIFPQELQNRMRQIHSAALNEPHC